MRQKLITVLSLVIIFSVVFGAQIATSASAETKNGNPLTSPVTFFKLSGNVTYKLFRFFSNNGQRFTPAAGVTVTAENIFNKDTYQTTTDADGNYTFSFEERGTFLVNPSGGQTNVYVPALQVVTAGHPGVRNNVNFLGLILP